MLLVTLKFVLAYPLWKQARIETLTQCTQWSQFTVDYFFNNLTDW